MIARGRIQKHEEGEPFAFVSQDKKKNLKGIPFCLRRPPSELKDFNRRGRRIECFNCHKHGHYAPKMSSKGK